MHPVAAILVLIALSAVSAVAGVFMLFGPGWALIALSAALAMVAGLIAKGLKSNG